MSKVFIIDSLKNIDAVASDLLEFFGQQKVFAFYGELGVGKTTLIKALCSQLGVKKGIKSPTFSIINTYYTDKNEPVYHFDCYRIENKQEFIDIGYDEYIYSEHYCFIEWADKVESLLPDDIVKLKISINEFNKYRIIKMFDV